MSPSLQLAWPQKPWVGPVLAGVLTVVVMVGFWLVAPPSLLTNDSSDYLLFYEPVARNLLAGQGFTLQGEPALAYPPGYPVLLAGVFGVAHGLGLSESLMLSLFELLCMASSAALLYEIARSLWGSRQALLVVAIWITYPYMLWMVKQPNVEIPFTLAFVGALGLFWLAVRRQRPSLWLYGGCGVLVGVASLIRPIAVGLGMVFVIVLWWQAHGLTRHQRLFMAVAVLVGNGLAIVPWQVWAYQQTGRFFLLSTNGVVSMRDGLTFAVDSKQYREQTELPTDVAEFMNSLVTQIKAGQVETFGQLFAFISQWLQAQPQTVVRIYAWKAARSWYASDSGRYEVPSILLQSIYGLLVLAAAVMAWRQGGWARSLVCLLGLTILYFWAMTTAVLSIARYMIPAIGPLFLLVPSLFAGKKPPLRPEPA